MPQTGSYDDFCVPCGLGREQSIDDGETTQPSDTLAETSTCSTCTCSSVPFKSDSFPYVAVPPSLFDSRDTGSTIHPVEEAWCLIYKKSHFLLYTCIF